jgi:hypothetical protein
MAAKLGTIGSEFNLWIYPGKIYLLLNQGMSVGNIDYHSPRKRLIAQLGEER